MKKKDNKNIISANKNFLIYGIILLFDIVLVIYCARQNKVHYIKYLDRNYLISRTRNMLLGNNYVNLIITLFFCFYLLTVRHFILKMKNSKKVCIIIFLGILFINLILFYVFTKRIY